MAQLGCSWPFFVEHMEEQFTPGMEWQNYGKDWVIHHLRPVADFDFRRKKEHVYVVNHWPNLRPLSQRENLARADTIHDDDIWQLEANIRKARRLGMTGRIPRQRTCRLNIWQTWLSLNDKARVVCPF